MKPNLFAPAFATACVFFSAPAFALCIETSDRVFICDGAVEPLWGLSDSRDGLDIFVDQIDDFLVGLSVPGDDHVIDVVGELRTLGSPGIDAGDNLTLTVDGGSVFGSDAVVAGDNLEMSVFGLLRGNRYGVDAGANAQIDFGPFGDPANGPFGGTLRGFTGARLGDGSAINLNDPFAEVLGFGDALIMGRDADIDLIEGSQIRSSGPDGNGVRMAGGSVFNEGTIFAEQVGILIESGTTMDTTIDIGFTGFVRGLEAGIRVEDGDASTTVEDVVVFGTVFGGIELGGGADMLRYSDQNAQGGVSYLGAGDDLLVLSNTLDGFNFVEATSYGGAGYDIADFSMFDGLQDRFDVMDIAGGGVQIDISTMFGTPFQDTFRVSLFEFEEFALGDMVLSRNALSLQFDLAPVPLPATAFLLAGGLVALGRFRTRSA